MIPTPAILPTLDDARPPSITDQVYEALYDRVVNLTLPPGARLSEAEVPATAATPGAATPAAAAPAASRLRAAKPLEPATSSSANRAAAGAATGVRARLSTARSGNSRRRAIKNVTQVRCQLFDPGGRPVSRETARLKS